MAAAEKAVKYGQRKKAWRESDLEKNNDIRGSDQAGDAENHTLSEHHDETPDEEATELLPLPTYLNPQSHVLAQKCLMEPGDSQWDNQS